MAIRSWLTPHAIGGIAIITIITHAFGNIAGIGWSMRVERTAANLASFAKLVGCTDGAFS